MQINKLEDLIQAEMTVKMGRQQIAVSVYLLDGVLVDTGPMRRKEELIPLYKDWELEKCVITHHHEDHTGLASWLQQHKQIPIYMHGTGVEICKKPGDHPLYRSLFWGERPAFQAEKIPQTFESNHYQWEVIHTPGHADDHIALYLPEKGWLFGGDVYVNTQPKSMYRFESVEKLIESLETLLSYDFDTYFCAHYGVLANGKKLLAKKLAYLVRVQEEILLLHEKGLSNKQIRQEMFPKRHMMHYVSFFENSPMHFIRSAIQSHKK